MDQTQTYTHTYRAVGQATNIDHAQKYAAYSVGDNRRRGAFKAMLQVSSSAAAVNRQGERRVCDRVLASSLHCLATLPQQLPQVHLSTADGNVRVCIPYLNLDQIYEKSVPYYISYVKPP